MTTLTPADFPWIVLLFPTCFIAFMVYGKIKTGKSFVELLTPDSVNELGNINTRMIISELINKIQQFFTESTKIPSLHEEISEVVFEQKFAKYHRTMVRDVAELWIENKNQNLGLSYQIVVKHIYDKAIGSMFGTSGSDISHDGIIYSVKLVVSQYDWNVKNA